MDNMDNTKEDEVEKENDDSYGASQESEDNKVDEMDNCNEQDTCSDNKDEPEDVSMNDVSNDLKELQHQENICMSIKMQSCGEPSNNDLKTEHETVQTTDDLEETVDKKILQGYEIDISSKKTEEDGKERKGENETKEEIITSSEPSISVYFLKKFYWKGESIQIVTQNENGPCPLLAIANVLVLSKRILLPRMQECITAPQLMEYIGDYILSVAPKNVDEAHHLDYQQNMNDAISIMYKLQTGIDVNVKFTGPRDFELTPECLVFDILNIGLYHGWLVDPQDSQMVSAVGSLSYNQLVEKIIKSKEENTEERDISEGLLAENFLENSATQLTYHGLCELNTAIKDEELCVFFRNNHFSTLYKFKGELFLLVTDQGYLNQIQIIWETLANVDGDGQFVDEQFHTVGPMNYQAPYSEPKPKTEHQMSQEDRDYLIALTLQEDNRENTNLQSRTQQQPLPASPQQQEAKDLQLARQLQEEDDRVARQDQQQRHQRNVQQLPGQRHSYEPPRQQQHSQQQQQRQVAGSSTTDTRSAPSLHQPGLASTELNLKS